ncbi:MAG: OmpA family protein [Cyclobacteriaceae bacterium]|nr:OmpA family protein [Cyclobacteriaceae bacterium SS2]
MRILAAICLIFIFLHVQGQQSVPEMIQMADTLYKSHRFLDAGEFYEKISKLDKNNLRAKYRLGICYKETLQYEKARNVLLELGKKPNHEYQARSLYYYANLLRLDEQFKNADSVYSYLIALPDVNADLIALSRKQREGCALALRQRKVNRGFSIKLFDDINSKFHDFGAVINPSNQNVVFASTRNRSVSQYEGNQYDGLLPDLVAYEKRRNGRFSSNTGAQKLDGLNTHWAEGSGSFTEDGKSFYYSSCETDDGSGCRIMVSYLVDGSWTTPEPLNHYINEPGSENKQPFVTGGGDTLFFSSNRPGGLGGSDIWMSLRGLEAESWSPPINMGGVINSPEEEISPYFSSAFNCLLFSSDGHVGYGGYDIYLAKGESFFEPEIYNLGYPFNSTIDDTYFMICDSVGFLSSNRGQDHRILNIYSFEIGDEALFLSLLISGESLIDSRIVSRFRDVRSLDLVTFRVEDYQGFEFFEPVKRERPHTDLISGDSLGGATERNNVSRRNNQGSLALQGQQRANFVVPNIDEVQTGASNQTNIDQSKYSLNQVLGKTADVDGTPYETIYFDYNLHELRPEAKQALSALVDQLNGKQYTQIVILAYSDNIGRETYNYELSLLRGNAVREYLESHGIPGDKMNVLPRGEVTRDEDHWFKRILSRKVEIVVQPESNFQFKVARTYIVRKDNSIVNIAGLLGVSTSDLRLWNAFKTDTIKAGNTIRVYEDRGRANIQYLVSEDDVSQFTENTGS